MSKSERDYVKRHLAHSMYDTVIAMQHLGHVYDITLPQHPELAEKLMVCINGYEVIAEVIKSFAQEITGREEINWEGWRQVSKEQLALQEAIDPALEHLYKQSAKKTYKPIKKHFKYMGKSGKVIIVDEDGNKIAQD